VTVGIAKEDQAMALEVEIKDIQPQPTVAVNLTTPYAEISEHLGQAYGAVMGYLAKIGAYPAGPAFARYNDNDTERAEWDITAGFPVSEPVAGEGQVAAGELPGGKAAVTWHIGAYDTIGETWKSLEAWLKARAHETASAPWEVYVTGAHEEPDASKWKTQIVWPIK
jgi:effector-binding domain-containing protein